MGTRLGIRIALLGSVAIMIGAATAQAGVTISSNPTKNMSCSGGLCTPKGKHAVLNVTDLTNMLATSDVRVGTTVKAEDIDVAASFSWASSNVLTLDAHRSIEIDEPISDAGPGGFAMLTNDGGTGGALSFDGKGNVTFMGLSNPLSINGNAYTLVDSIAALASDIASNPNGFYALAKNYNAKHDGTYGSAPIATTFNGIFEGLGNTISNMTIVDGTQQSAADGLFREIDSGWIRDFGLVNASVTSTGGQGGNNVGTLAAFGGGTIWRSYATGSVICGIFCFAGGLESGGAAILQSHADVTVTCSEGCNAGGLVGVDQSTISQSFAAGAVTMNSDFSSIGGLVGKTGQGSVISQSYATGAVSITDQSATGTNIGGLVGCNGCGTAQATISQSYSTGLVSAPNAGCSNTNCVGGLIGFDQGGDTNASTYWDTTTSGITDLSQGAGNIPNDPGITGLTTKKFQSGLPQGFDPAVWGEKSKINGGFPYLRALQ